MRKTSYRHGVTSEILCMAWLMVKGYRILAWRFRTISGEVDIVAQKSKMIAFVEVKARATQISGMEAISAASQKRISSAAADYIQRKANRAKFSFRFDLMIVVPGRWPVHIPNAWQD